MRLSFFIALSIGVLLTACGSKKAAFDYSEKLVAMEQSLVPDITETEDKVEIYLTNGQFDSAKTVSQRMEDKIAEKIKEVENTPPPQVNEAENFKKAFLKYFSYMKSIYTSYAKYASQTTEEDRGMALEEMMNIINNKKEAIEEVQRMQVKFAKANGFSVNK
jgi:hypothetical protein